MSDGRECACEVFNAWLARHGYDKTHSCRILDEETHPVPQPEVAGAH